MRYIEPFILEDLAKKMVFVGGPRQVGKTTMAKIWGHHTY
jgi:predicted AAA+ superfamily ATPase